MAAKADLHIHSTASDGAMPPEQVVAVARELGLTTIALTDHDSIAGIQKARKAAEEIPVRVMNGIEITTAFRGREVHMLAYAFDIENEKLTKLLSDHKKARMERAKAIIRQLQKEGLELTIDEVMAEAATNNICRPHIAMVLVDKGYIATPKEAFIRYLSDEAIGELQDFYYSLSDVIAIIKNAGGVTVIAHPGRLYTEDELEEMVEMGIDGIEIIHPGHNYPMQQRLDEFAKKHNLLKTGGSDFHGNQKKFYKNFGIIGITEKDVEKIERMARHRKKTT